MSDVRIEAFEGNTLDVLFVLKQFNQHAGRDVSGADAIWLELDYPDGVAMTRLPANAGHTEADWVNGRVVVRIDRTNATGSVGAYPFALTVEEGGEVETVVSGLILSRDRPGFPHPD